MKIPVNPQCKHEIIARSVHIVSLDLVYDSFLYLMIYENAYIFLFPVPASQPKLCLVSSSCGYKQAHVWTDVKVLYMNYKSLCYIKTVTCVMYMLTQVCC